MAGKVWSVALEGEVERLAVRTPMKMQWVLLVGRSGGGGGEVRSSMAGRQGAAAACIAKQGGADGERRLNARHASNKKSAAHRNGVRPGRAVDDYLPPKV